MTWPVCDLVGVTCSLKKSYAVEHFTPRTGPRKRTRPRNMCQGSGGSGSPGWEPSQQASSPPGCLLVAHCTEASSSCQNFLTRAHCVPQLCCSLHCLLGLPQLVTSSQVAHGPGIDSLSPGAGSEFEVSAGSQPPSGGSRGGPFLASQRTLVLLGCGSSLGSRGHPPREHLPRNLPLFSTLVVGVNRAWPRPDLTTSSKALLPQEVTLERQG